MSFRDDDKKSSFHVHGKIADAAGTTIPDVEVTVWWQRIRHRVKLASGRASEDGTYHLEYPAPDDTKGRLLIVVEARSPRLAEPLESSLTPAEPDLQLDLKVPAADQSEYGLILSVIMPLLEGLPVTDLVENDDLHDLTYLSTETGRSAEDLMRLVVAARLQALYELPAEAFYAFLRLHVPTSIPAPLLEASQGFTLIDALVRRVGSLIVGLDPGVQEQTLRTAARQQLVPTRLLDEIPKLVAAFQNLRRQDVLTQPYLVGKTSLRQLLEFSKLPADKQQTFAQLLVDNTDRPEKFWQRLSEGQSGFTPAEVASVRRTLELGPLVKNQGPLLNTVRARFDSGALTSLPDLAPLTKQDWLQLIRESGPGSVPSNIAAAGNATPEEVFAQEIYYRVTRAYPTAALASRVKTGQFVPERDKQAVEQFFSANRDLDLRRQNLAIYLERQQSPTGGQDFPKNQAVLDRVMKFQRVLRISPHVDTAETLLNLNISSSAQIAALGKQQFVDKVAQAGLTRLEGYKVYYQAEQRYASVVSLLMQFNNGFIGIYPAGTGPAAPFGEPIANAIRRNPSLANLFGSQDVCAVDFCTSLLSPAAYLTDILLWLRNRLQTGPFPNALAAFFDRRPDIGHLLLNCPNSETPLPYIDLVNELLEDAVNPPGAPVWKQTTRTARELRAAPEYVNNGAYVTLAAANYPHTLPYDRALDELRTYLEQSGVALWQLRMGLQPVQGPAPAAQLQAIAAERFSMPQHEADLINTADFINIATAWNVANPATALRTVAAFLSASQLTYEQLLELLDVVWINGGGAPSALAGVDDTCDTTVQTITNLDDAKLDRIHRFLRLWRRTGWTMWELDLLLRAPAVGAGAINLPALFNFRQIQDATRLSLDSLLVFYQNIDTASHRAPDGSVVRSLYSSLFENPALPADPALILATLLAGPAPDLSAHSDAVRAALQISAGDFATLAPLTDGKLTLENLSALFRLSQLAAALRLTVDDLLRAGPAPITAVFAGLDQTLVFIDRVSAIRQSGFTLDALTYVLTRNPSPVALSDTGIAAVLTDVRRAMQQVNDGIFASSDAPLVVLRRWLAQLASFADATVLAAASIVDGSFTGGTPARDAFIDAHFALFMDPAVAKARLGALVSNPADPVARQAEIDSRARLVLSPLAPYLTVNRAISAVAGDLHLATDTTALMTSRLRLTSAGTPTLLSTLTDLSLIAKTPGSNNYVHDITPADFPDQFTSITLLDKAGTIVRRLRLVAADVAWLLDHSSDAGGVNLAQLPVVASQPALPIDQLLATVLVIQLNRAFTNPANSGSGPQSLFDLIAAVKSGAIATDAAAQAALATITGWPQADIQALTTGISFSLAAGDYLRPKSYEALRKLVAMSIATGGSGAQLVSWGIAVPTGSVAASALDALKSKYPIEAWLDIAPKLMNPMRDRWAAALASFLLAQRDGGGNPVWGVDENDLFNRFLIDVRMSSCEVTTRVIQAYAAVQLFVQRCLMNLEDTIVADPTSDSGWTQWKWMQRYRIWEANRKVFLYPENWLVESQRPTRSEIMQKLEQEVQQQENTADNLESIALNYIDRLDEIAHPIVTGMCTDPVTGDIHAVGRTNADPARFFFRTFKTRIRQWTPWQQIPLEIRSHQVIPAVYRRRVYLFWPQITLANEPKQNFPAPQASSNPPNQDVARHVEINLFFSVYRNGAWAAAQMAKGKLFDVPLLNQDAVTDNRSVEPLYSLKTQVSGANLFVDVFRQGPYDVFGQGSLRVFSALLITFPFNLNNNMAVHIGRAVFDGRISELELRNLNIFINGADTLLVRAQNLYGPDAQVLTPLPDSESDPNLLGQPGLTPRSGALATLPRGPSDPPTSRLVFDPVSAQDRTGPLLMTAPLPFSVLGSASDLNFDPASFFFYADGKRAFFVEPIKLFAQGSQWTPVAPSNPAGIPFRVRYSFRRFYHPYTKLLWHELASGGFGAIYNTRLQKSPDTANPANLDTFSFRNTYQPVTAAVSWGEDNEILDFTRDAAYAPYNWELFYHLPLYIAERLSQNQRFEEALTWYHYIFDPTNPGPDPVPQRYWVTKPLNELTSAAVLQQRINQLLALVNQHDPNAEGQVAAWRDDPFDPFLIADQRPVVYMKKVVMSYLDNLIAWADNLFATDSREALNQATLLYVLASEVLGPQPSVVPPPKHLDASFDDLLPKLDDFANALVDIENVAPASGGGADGGGAPLPLPQTFFFKIPPNEKLQGYWTTVADRLFKLRHCQNIQGITRQLALFDAPIDPALLVRASAAGVDLGSVISDVAAPLPSYRYSVLYANAQDFCEAVKGYGAQLLTALEKKDAEALAVLLATQQRDLSQLQSQIYDAKAAQAQSQIDALNQSLSLAQSRYDFYNEKATASMNAGEVLATGLSIASAYLKTVQAITLGIASGLYLIPRFMIGGAGFGGTPTANASTGGDAAGSAGKEAADATGTIAEALDKNASLIESFLKRADDQEAAGQTAKEAQIQMDQIKAQIIGAQLAQQIATIEQSNHQAQIAQLEQELEFMQAKFSSADLYDWLVGKLSDTYFQSYRLAYAMAKRAERCYRYELGLIDSSFVTFGYWDSLKKGLFAGDALAQDLRRMQSSYFELNARRFEISRYVSLAELDPTAFVALLRTGNGQFSLPETFFDGDYPGHYQRRLTRVSITVMSPDASATTNIKCTLTLTGSSVRLTPDLTPGYARTGPSDTRFSDRFGAVQRIVTGNAQDDPGLFQTSITDNLADPRYLPFEGAGAISTWQLELPAGNNELDLSSVTDVRLHLFYTALDGGDTLKQAAREAFTAALPASSARTFSVRNDFPVSWANFLTSGGGDQVLTLPVTAAKFPAWTRGQTITIQRLDVFTISSGGSFVLAPQAPLPTATVNLNPPSPQSPVANGTVMLPPATGPEAWSFKLRASDAADFNSLTAGRIGDVLVAATFQAS